MAAIKRGIDRRQTSLVVPAQVESLKKFLASRDDESDFDAFEDDAHADPDARVNVVVAQLGDHFTIARMRDDGTSSCSVHYTRDELVELRALLTGMEL